MFAISIVLFFERLEKAVVDIEDRGAANIAMYAHA